jgi:hypothetical protein
MKLWKRAVERDSRAVWMAVAEGLKDHRAPSAARAARNIRKVIRRRRLPALIHNGGKA